MSVPTCQQLKEAYLALVLAGGEQLIKVGDQLVKFTDPVKLKAIIEEMCGPIVPEGSTANKGLILHQGQVFGRGSRPRNGCGCEGDDD